MLGPHRISESCCKVKVFETRDSDRAMSLLSRPPLKRFLVTVGNQAEMRDMGSVFELTRSLVATSICCRLAQLRSLEADRSVIALSALETHNWAVATRAGALACRKCVRA